MLNIQSYSSWKVKSKVITKSIKLTNATLESLNTNSDALIKQFAWDIVASLNDASLYPSWFVKSGLEQKYQTTLAYIEAEIKSCKTSYEDKVLTYKAYIDRNNGEKSKELFKLETETKYFNKLKSKLNKISNAKKSIVKTIFSLFIYNILTSQKRKSKFQAKCDRQQKVIDALNAHIDSLDKTIVGIENKISIVKSERDDKIAQLEQKKKEAYDTYTEKLQLITSLPIDIDSKNEFIPLKKLIGYEYSKIIGCYVIHNRSNDKYYVGQSKDVIKRLHQHFKGTVPNNVIFAEDYYSSPEDNRDNLFEVKIIKCSTKDELDRTEKQLIEDYDAFRSGYNGTAGNN